MIINCDNDILSINRLSDFFYEGRIICYGKKVDKRIHEIYKPKPNHIMKIPLEIDISWTLNTFLFAIFFHWFILHLFFSFLLIYGVWSFEAGVLTLAFGFQLIGLWGQCCGAFLEILGLGLSIQT